MKKILILCLVCTALGGCHWFASEEEDFIFHFNESMVTVEVGMMGALYLTVDPVSMLQDYRLKYTIDEISVVTIRDYSNNSVLFTGKSQGSAILTAELAGKKTQAVITVTGSGE
jgi:outer membrane lipopolysaccharide assembly protein LptE/RlpB